MARERLLSGERTFSELAEEHRWRFHAADLVFAGRWVTPPCSAARFDTTYFLARIPSGQEPSIEDVELAAGEWIAPAQAIARWKEGAATFGVPILRMLEELERGEEGLVERLVSAPGELETLFPAHGSLQGAAVRRVRVLLRHRREREARVLATRAPLPHSLAEIVERAYADTPRDLWKYAERSLLAHLIKLEAEGRATREGERWRRAQAAPLPSRFLPTPRRTRCRLRLGRAIPGGAGGWIMGHRPWRAGAQSCLAALLSVALIVVVAACDRQAAHLPVAPQPPPPTDSTAALYRGDACALAIEEMIKPGSPYRGVVEIPSWLVNELHQALLAVHAADHIPARDSVVVIYKIRARGQPGSIIVAVDTTYGWTAAWGRGEVLTGEPAVDALVRRYGLVLEAYYRWPFGSCALLASMRALNMYALAPCFQGIPGVRYAQPNYLMGDGSTIHASREAGGWRLDYALGWGDCPAGCTGWHTWSFLVGPDHVVHYLGSSGPTPPHR